MAHSNDPLALHQLFAGVVVTVVGGVILAFLLREGMFAPTAPAPGFVAETPAPTATVPPPTVAPTALPPTATLPPPATATAPPPTPVQAPLSTLWDLMQARRDEGLGVTELTYATDRWRVVMSRSMDTRAARWTFVSAPAFPRALIEDRWADGYRVTVLTYGNGRWVVVMTDGAGYGAQVFERAASESWSERIRLGSNALTQMGEGYAITEVAHGDGEWVVVLTQGTSYGEQQLRFFHAELPVEWIQQQRDAGYHLTALTHGNGQWNVVMTAGLGYTDQFYQTSAVFPADAIAEKWGLGYRITVLELQDGLWILVMSLADPIIPQTWQDVELLYCDAAGSCD